jgi:hypothetical protein
MTIRKTAILSAAAFVLIGMGAGSARAQNLVVDGNFTPTGGNGGVGELGISPSSPSYTAAYPWYVGPTVDGNPDPFAFIINSQADSQGFPSAFSPPHITIWGPGSGSVWGPSGGTQGAYSVQNGWNGLPNGYSYALGVDGDYADAPVSQDIKGLTVGTTYTLSFQWSAAQLTGFTGGAYDWWNVTFGSTTVPTPMVHNDSQGFTGWMDFSTTFTATSTMQTLTFLAKSTGIGEPPFLMLDGVSLTAQTAAVPEPGSLLMLGMSTVGLLGAGWYRRRARAAQA